MAFLQESQLQELCKDGATSMTNIAKYAWCFFLAALTLGIWTIPILIVLVIVNLYLLKKHPEWYK